MFFVNRDPVQARIYKMIDAYTRATGLHPTHLIAGPEYAAMIDSETRGTALVVCGLIVQRVEEAVFLVMEGRWPER